MTDDILLIDTDERVRTLTLNRPQSRNALSSALRDCGRLRVRVRTRSSVSISRMSSVMPSR